MSEQISIAAATPSGGGGESGGAATTPRGAPAGGGGVIVSAPKGPAQASLPRRPNVNPPPRVEGSRMSLSVVTRGLRDEPLLMLVYGTEGVGKTSFCARAPAPIFLFANDGTAELDVPRFPRAEKWADILDAIQELRTAKHGYKTLVIDELGAVEASIHWFVCHRDGKLTSDGKPSIEAYGYGKGYVAALDEWRLLLSRLETLRAERGLNVLLTAHAHIKTQKSPDVEVGDYDRWQVKLDERSAGFLKEQCKVVLFAEFETTTKKATDAPKERRQVGIDTGARILHTRRSAPWDAKNRLGLPERLPLSWAAFERAVEEGRTLRQQLADALRGRSESDARMAMDYIEAEGYSASAYTTIIERLKGTST